MRKAKENPLHFKGQPAVAETAQDHALIKMRIEENVLTHKLHQILATLNNL